MPRRIPIRITKNDRQEFKRLVNSAKAKVRRTSKNYGIDLSDEIKLPKLEDFQTREDFNKWKTETKSFTNRHNQRFQFVKNEHGVVASKSEINQLKRQTKEAQRLAKERKKEVAKLPFYSGGREQTTIGERMKQMKKPDILGIHVPNDFDFNKVRSRRELERRKENIEKRSRPEHFNRRTDQMRENLTDLISKTFNSDGDEIIRRLKGMPTEDFYELFLMFDELQFDYIYTNDSEMDQGAYLNKIENYLHRYEAGKINMDLKDF